MLDGRGFELGEQAPELARPVDVLTIAVVVVVLVVVLVFLVVAIDPNVGAVLLGPAVGVGLGDAQGETPELRSVGGGEGLAHLRRAAVGLTPAQAQEREVFELGRVDLAELDLLHVGDVHVQPT